MADEGTLKLGNFRLRLKKWKFEMHSYNLLLTNGTYLWLNLNETVCLWMAYAPHVGRAL